MFSTLQENKLHSFVLPGINTYPDL